MSDLTRTWPVNGKFNSWQRELYGFYVKCYQSILDAIRAGVKAAVIQREALDKMERILEDVGFSKDIYEKAAEKLMKKKDFYKNIPKHGEEEI